MTTENIITLLQFIVSTAVSFGTLVMSVNFEIDIPSLEIDQKIRDCNS